jgi:hypothetical protein
MATSAKSGEKPLKSKAAAAKPAAKTAAAKPAATKAPASDKPVKATKSVAAKPAATKPAAAKPAKATSAKKTAATVPNLAPEQRRYYVEVAAYYIAERRGFQGGSAMEDWAQAEREIDRLLLEGILKP